MDRIEKLCLDKGMRMTEQRRVVARVLSQSHDQPDVEELYRRAAAETAGAHAVFLEVASDNTAAIALYEREGFAPAGIRRGYYAKAGAPPQDALVLRRALNSAGA